MQQLDDWFRLTRRPSSEYEYRLLSASEAPFDPATAALRVSTTLNGLPFPLWQGDPRPNHVWDGNPRTSHDGQKPPFTGERPSPGTLSHDFEITRFHTPGRVHIVLRVSGRILRVITQGAARMESRQEIVPAFFGADGTSQMAADVPEPKIPPALVDKPQSSPL